MQFASDNTGPVHPDILAALGRANDGYAPAYGDEPEMERVRDRLRDIFEAPEAAVFLVATGTAANALILSTLSQPWQTIYCAPLAHIHTDECNAPEFYAAGTKLTVVPGAPDKIAPDALEAAIVGEEDRGVHGCQPGPVSVTQLTDRGRVYSLDELRAVTATARAFGLPVHLDGARFANALVALGCTPAEMTWKAGVDAVSFGGTKNGCMGVEAVIFFNPDHAWEFELRRKRAAHLFSKHRYLTAQMAAYLEGDLWLDLARSANRAAARLADGLARHPDVRFAHDVDANLIFAWWPRALHRRMVDAGAVYSMRSGRIEGSDPDEPLLARLVCDWSASDAATDRFLQLMSG